MNKIIVQKDQARLYGRPYPIPQGQSQFSEIEFSFSEEWANLRKIAQFEQKGEPYNVDISDNRCFCPSELVKGWVNIRVKGYPEDTTSAVIATANEITLPVSMGFKSGGTPPVPPTPDLYQKLVEEFSDKVQSDWNQNNHNEKDYIKNRTHWEDEATNRILVPKTLVNRDNPPIVPINFEVNQPFEAVVTWGGIEYTARFKRAVYPEYPLLIHNQSYWCLGEPNPDSELPFIVVNPYENFAQVMFSGDGAELSITVKGPEVHYVDPKYIKDFYFSEKVLRDYPVSVQIWWNLTRGGKSPIIPLIKVAGVQYKELSPSKVDGINYYYTAGEYTLQFHAAQGEEYRWYSCIPEAEAFFQHWDLEITKIPPEYIPIEFLEDALGIFQLRTELNGKIGPNNPVFTGAISVNRLIDTTVGAYSTTVGSRGKATGKYSFAGGYESQAVAEGAFAFGRYCQAQAPYSFAVGKNSSAEYEGSHAEGSDGQAFGIAAHVEGYNCIAYDYSHAEGFQAHAEAKYAHAEGMGVYSAGDISHVQGRYNIENLTLAHVVGNGSTDSKRSNAHTLDWEGNAWFAGDVYTGSASGTNKDAGSKKLATEEYVDTVSAAFVVAVTPNDSGVLSADKTFADTLAACKAGRTVKVKFDTVSLELPLADYSDSQIVFRAPQFSVNRLTQWAQITMTASEITTTAIPNDVIIASSTAGSTKLFKLTVDDSGTISATEVTS